MYESIKQIKDANAARGDTWFGKREMALFGSRIESDVVGGKFFVTSEEVDGLGRAYTVRQAHKDGDIRNAGDFMQYGTLGAALEAATTLALGDHPTPA